MSLEYCILEPGRKYATEIEKITLEEALVIWKGVDTEGFRLVRVGNYPSGEVLRKKDEDNSSYYIYSFEKTPDIYDIIFPVVEILKVKR